MKKLREMLVKYAYENKCLPDASYEVYEYAVQMGFEMAAGFLASLLIALCMGMIVESVIFLIVFCGIRSYAGGLHLDKFSRCFILSASITVGVLAMVKYISVPITTSGILLFSGITALLITRPANHRNREVNWDEEAYFQKKLHFVLAGVCMIFLLCAFLKLERYGFLLAITTDTAYISVILGKFHEKGYIGEGNL